jgi:hypothetical protein
MIPGPLGMAETNPNAEAPQMMAMCASAGDLIQQILILGRVCTWCVDWAKLMDMEPTPPGGARTKKKEKVDFCEESLPEGQNEGFCSETNCLRTGHISSLPVIEESRLA